MVTLSTLNSDPVRSEISGHVRLCECRDVSLGPLKTTTEQIIRPIRSYVMDVVPPPVNHVATIKLRKMKL